jgi:hypothetical protein
MSKPTKESMLNLWATMGLLVKAVSNESWKKGKNNEKTYQAIRRLIESQLEVTTEQLLDFAFHNAAESNVAKIYESIINLFKKLNIGVKSTQKRESLVRIKETSNSKHTE